MEKILDVANYLCQSYEAQTDEEIDELKLHKLLYFAQRESIALTGEPMFSESLEGWVHGPVSPLVRNSFYDGKIVSDCSQISDENKWIVNRVISEYGSLASWKLRNLSHKETSWIKSRRGLEESQSGAAELSLDDIRLDAEKVRPFDETWGMYYDEFKDEDSQ